MYFLFKQDLESSHIMIISFMEIFLNVLFLYRVAVVCPSLLFFHRCVISSSLDSPTPAPVSPTVPSTSAGQRAKKPLCPPASSQLNRLLGPWARRPFGGQQGLAEGDEGRGPTGCDASDSSGRFHRCRCTSGDNKASYAQSPPASGYELIKTHAVADTVLQVFLPKVVNKLKGLKLKKILL